MNDDRLLARIERALGAPGLVDALARLPGADLQSLLLAVQRRRAASLDAGDVLRAYRENRFVQPSPVDVAALREVERTALDLLPPGFEALDLSPVAPFGTSAVLGAIPQDWVLASGRNTEVVSDPTAVLALECALRRRALRQDGSAGRVDLFTVQRTIRGQPFDPPFRQHFGLIALCSAGRDDGGNRFDAETLVDHLAFYLELGGAPLRVELTSLAGGLAGRQLEERVVVPLAERFPDASFGFDRERQAGRPGYYVRTCFKVWRGKTNLADGGFADWTERLLGDRKERLLTSGLGTEGLAQV